MGGAFGGASGGSMAQGGATGGSAAQGGAAGGTGGGGTGGGESPKWGIEARPTNQTCKRPPARDQAAPLLSQTGCVDPANPKLPAPGVIPYAVASPLWSDGAKKDRFMALPDGAFIRVKDCQRDPSACEPGNPAFSQDEGDWDFPDGTVLVKNFAIGERMVETRLLVRADADNWWGYSYAWREDQSDAELLPSSTDGELREITTPDGKQTWHYPSRTQCLQCHTDTSGRALGPETSQLNIDFVYPNGVKGNQIETLIHAGFFEPGQEPRSRPAYPDPADTSLPIEARARSYLHSNCAVCHRPGADASTTIDLRFEATFEETQLCDVPPEKGDFGPDFMRLKPGDPEKSVLSVRMHTLDPQMRMPRIGTMVVDELGVTVVDEWIRSLTGCP